MRSPVEIESSPPSNQSPLSGRPLLFLDIDGVLNRIGPDFPRARPEGGRGARLHIPDGTAERVERLAGVFEPVWASAWRAYAARAMAKPLKLKTVWPYLRYKTSKLPAIIEYAGERPWAWVDDELTWEPKAVAMIGTPFLILHPDPAVGLTDDHVEDLLEFANSVL